MEVIMERGIYVSECACNIILNANYVKFYEKNIDGETVILHMVSPVIVV